MLHGMLEFTSIAMLRCAKLDSLFSEDELVAIQNSYYAVSGIEIPSVNQDAIRGDGEDTVLDEIFGLQSKVIYEVFLEQTI